MNLQALRVFCEVARFQSFSRGAAACGITQSAASQLISHLEKEIEVKLLDRKERPLKVTPEGEVYHRGCQELLHKHRAMIEEMRGLREQSRGEIRVASIYSVGLHTLTRYIQRFTSDNPGTDIRLEYLHPDKVYAAVLDDQADIGVTSYPRLTRGLVVIPWLEEEMVLACRPEHRLARKRKVHPRDLKGEKFVGFVSDLPIRREIDRALKHCQVGVEVGGEFDNIETIKEALEISNSVSILPKASIEREVERGMLVAVPIDMINLKRPVGIIHQKKKKLTRIARKFLDALVDRR